MVPPLLMLMAFGAAEARTVDVCGSGCEFEVLQEALDDASVDEILLSNESYAGPFSAKGRVVQLIGSSSTRLHCGGAPGEVSTVAIRSGTLVLENLLVEPCLQGRAVGVYEGSRLYLENATIDGGSQVADVEGRGVYLEANTQGHAFGSVFQDLHAGSASGGAVWLGSGVEWFDQDSLYVGNRAATGAAIYATSATVLLDGGHFDGNWGGTAGGSVWAWRGTLDVWATTFEDGRASKGSYLYTDRTAVNLWPGTRFSGGQGYQCEHVEGVVAVRGVEFEATHSVSGLFHHQYLSGSNLLVRASSFTDLRSPAVKVQGDDGPTQYRVFVESSDFLSNSGSQGALYVNGPRMLVTDTVFEGNSVGSGGQAGAIGLDGTTYTHRIEYSRFCYNSGSTSGIYLKKSGSDIYRNLFLGHQGRLLYAGLDCQARFENNTILDGAEVAFFYGRSKGSFNNNVVERRSAGQGMSNGDCSGGGCSPAGNPSSSYNAYRGDTVSPLYTFKSDQVGDFSFGTSPALRTSRSNWECFADLRPTNTSPLVDAGVPGQQDPDGSPIDIGAFPAEDADADGSPVGTDCNDQARNQKPGLQEICDGIDNDCDGQIDEGTTEGRVWYVDSDGDGFGSPSGAVTSCTFVSGRVLNKEDCADTDASRNPLVNEVCGDGIDNNCDGFADDPSSVDVVLHYADRDDDGYGDDATEQRSCVKPTNRVDIPGDCNDDALLVSPEAEEVCDGIDNNCDGKVDDELAIDPASWWLDSDGDGFGAGDEPLVQCDAPTGFVGNNTDCNDDDSAVSPDGVEVCSGRSEDCDEEIDEDPADAVTYWPDADGDGQGDEAGAERFCAPPQDYVGNSDDCDDADAAVKLGGLEVCNGIDDDCDGVVDPSTASDAQLWFDDVDGDGFGDPASGEVRCGVQGVLVLDGTDCDDANVDANPGGVEVCNGIDDDCVNGADGPDAGDARSWFPDDDDDGFGALEAPVVACEGPSGSVDVSGDCDDGVKAINPAATEVCNGADDDCDGGVDGELAADAVDWYLDDDGDGFGDDTDVVRTCDPVAGRTTEPGDCDDAAADVNPDASEVCNAVDDNCSGAVDDGLEFVTLFRDDDEDGWGAGEGEVRCEGGLGWAETSTDCDDGDPTVSPGAEEVWYDGVDQDCDGNDDDQDLDGFLGEEAGGEDCDDLDALTYPGAPPAEDGTPRDCITVLQVVSLGGGCGGCSGSGGSPLALWVLALVGLARRQARSPV